MADDSSGEKTQDATQHRRDQVREEGRVVHSSDLNSAALLLISLVTILYAGGICSIFWGGCSSINSAGRLGCASVPKRRPIAFAN